MAPVDWLLVGLGNPGRRYERTRHNAGFMVLDELARRWGLDGARAERRYAGRLLEGRVPHGAGPGGGAGPRVALLWPQTYMNDAGRSVGPARGAYRLDLEHVLVVHDEIDLPFGEVRERIGGGLAGHNGLKSLRRELGGEGFRRVRLGVGRPDSTDPDVVADYVLAPFEQTPADVRALIDAGADLVQSVIAA